jgi:hypothetical protein
MSSQFPQVPKPPQVLPPVQPLAGMIAHLQQIARTNLVQSHQTFLANIHSMKQSADQRDSRKATEQVQKKSRHSKARQPAKKLDIRMGPGNFPSIYQAYDISREKKIKKKKRKRNDKLIKRLDIDLINISTKIEEEIVKKGRNKYVRPTNSKKAYNQHLIKAKKLSKIKKKIETIKILTQGSTGFSALESSPDIVLPYPINEEEKKLLSEKPNQLAFKLRKRLNNSSDVKKCYDSNFEIREYVENVQTKELDHRVLKFLNHLNFSQLLKKRLEPLKYKKRLVYGFNEVTKSLEMTRKEM